MDKLQFQSQDIPHASAQPSPADPSRAFGLQPTTALQPDGCSANPLAKRHSTAVLLP